MILDLSISIDGEEFHLFSMDYPEFIDNVETLHTAFVSPKTLIKNFMLWPRKDGRERKVRFICDHYQFDELILEIYKVFIMLIIF